MSMSLWFRACQPACAVSGKGWNIPLWCWMGESDCRGSIGCAADNTGLFACEVLTVIGGEVYCEIRGVLPSIEISLLQDGGVR